MNEFELLKRFDTLLEHREGRLLAHIHTIIHYAKDQIMSLIDDATAATAAKVFALAAEVTKANAKTDAALAALAASVASGAPVTQAQLDAINAIGTEADAATSALQVEESKVDAATGTTAEPPIAASGAPDAAA